MTIAITPVSPRYQPLAQIGRGAIAETILAEMQMGDGVTSLAVLRRLLPELADDPEFVATFLREGRLSVRMNHPNIVRTYELVEHAEGSAIAMEYLDGQRLARVLNRLMSSGALGLAGRLRVLIDVLEALAYAHELPDYDGSRQGIVHGDVNPQNVFVTYDGLVKLLSFGVAKSATDAYRTRPGALRGKLAYLAPEQALGEVVDQRADVFSVGVMLWEMLTGRRMWQSMTEVSIMRQLVAGAIPALPRDPRLPRALVEACTCALARAPHRRFASAKELASELRRAMPNADEGKGRHLGRLVAFAFAPERAARRTLIEEHLRRSLGVPGRAVGWGGGADVGAWGGDPPPPRANRITSGGMWSVGDQPSDDGIWDATSLASIIEEPSVEVSAVEVSAVEVSAVEEAPHLEAVAQRPPASTDSQLTVAVAAPLRFRRVRWMAGGFAIAAVLAGAAWGPLAARSRNPSVNGDDADGALRAAAARASRLVQPVIERAAAVPSQAAAPVGGGAEPGLVLYAERPYRPRRRWRPRPEPEAEPAIELAPDPPETDGRKNAGLDGSSAARGGTHSDDETLEPTVDTVGASAGPGPATRAAARRERGGSASR